MKDYPYTQADETPEIDAAARKAGEDRADQAAILEEVKKNMRPLAEIIVTHDILNGLLSEEPFPLEKSVRDELYTILNTLCWVMGHKAGKWVDVCMAAVEMMGLSHGVYVFDEDDPASRGKYKDPSDVVKLIVELERFIEDYEKSVDEDDPTDPDGGTPPF